MDEKRQAEAVPHAAGAAPARPQAGAVRISAKRKVGAVMRLIKGESLEIVAREMGVTAAKLSEWRDTVLSGAETLLKERERDARDEEISRLKTKVGETTMEVELLREKIRRLEAGVPFARRRSRK